MKTTTMTGKELVVGLAVVSWTGVVGTVAYLTADGWVGVRDHKLGRVDEWQPWQLTVL
jgi:hypothetical protein